MVDQYTGTGLLLQDIFHTGVSPEVLSAVRLLGGVPVFSIAEGRGNHQTCFLLLPIAGADPTAAVSGVEVIDQSLETHNEIVVFVKGVDIFRSVENTHVVLPQVVNEERSLGAVTAQPGQVLDDDGFDFPSFHHFIDAVDACSIEVHAADIIVKGFSYDLMTLADCKVVDDLALIFQGVQFLVFITGQAIVEPDFYACFLPSEMILAWYDTR